MTNHHRADPSVCVFLGLALSALSFGSGLGLTAEPDPIALKTIVEHWKMRQDRVKSARFVWTGVETDARGSMSSPETQRSGSGPVVPPEDISFDVPNTFLLDGNKVRYTYEGKSWSTKKKGLLTHDYVAVFNGKVAKSFNPAGGFSSLPIGQVHAGDEHPDVRNINLQPILMTYRASNPKMCVYHSADLRISPERRVLAGRPCIVLEDRTAVRGSSRVLWVDPARDYSIVRFLTTINDKVYYQLDVTYIEHVKHGWVPNSWNFTVLKPDGGTWQAERAKVTEWAINEPINAKQFEMQFPPGTRVFEPDR